MRSRYKPSRAKAKEFAQKMDEISDFCAEHRIGHSSSMDSFYFSIGEKFYRVSNHTVEASNRAAFNELGQTRELYHTGRDTQTIYIHASKTRLIEVYNNILSGRALDSRGNVKE